MSQTCDLEPCLFNISIWVQKLNKNVRLRNIIWNKKSIERKVSKAKSGPATYFLFKNPSNLYKVTESCPYGKDVTLIESTMVIPKQTYTERANADTAGTVESVLHVWGANCIHLCVLSGGNNQGGLSNKGQSFHKYQWTACSKNTMARKADEEKGE